MLRNWYTWAAAVVVQAWCLRYYPSARIVVRGNAGSLRSDSLMRCGACGASVSVELTICPVCDGVLW